MEPTGIDSSDGIVLDSSSITGGSEPNGGQEAKDGRAWLGQLSVSQIRFFASNYLLPFETVIFTLILTLELKSLALALLFSFVHVR